LRAKLAQSRRDQVAHHLLEQLLCGHLRAARASEVNWLMTFRRSRKVLPAGVHQRVPPGSTTQSSTAITTHASAATGLDAWSLLADGGAF
jgi:hypothetical protein